MIFGKLAIFFNLLSIMVFSVLFIILTLSIMIKSQSAKLREYSVSSRRRVLWYVVISPWFFGFLVAAFAILSGSQYSPFSQSFDLLHWHHSQEFSFSSWHGLSMIASLLYISFLLIRKIYNLIINRQQIKLLHALAELDENKFYQLDADAATAFTAGYLSPRCYITTTLRRQLNDDEYRILRLHEKEHARRFDPLKKWFFQLFAAFFPQAIFQTLNQLMSLVMEQCADLAVSRKISDRTLIAQTLLKVRRLAAKPFASALDSSTLCHYSNDNIEERISFLLSDQQSKVFPIFLFIFAAIIMSVFCALAIDIFHHTIEFTLAH